MKHPSEFSLIEKKENNVKILAYHGEWYEFYLLRSDYGK
jgi:hypothetical protein